MGKKATSDGGERRKVAGAVNPAVTEIPVLAESVSCPTCGQLNPPLGAQTKSTGWGQPVYAVGRLSPQFPTIGVEKGFAQLTEGAYQGDQVEVEELQRVRAGPRMPIWDGTYAGVSPVKVSTPSLYCRVRTPTLHGWPRCFRPPRRRR